MPIPTMHNTYMTALMALLAKNDCLDHPFEIRDANDWPDAQISMDTAFKEFEDAERGMGPIVKHDLHVTVGAVALGFVRVYLDPESGDTNFCRILPQR